MTDKGLAASAGRNLLCGVPPAISWLCIYAHSFACRDYLGNLQNSSLPGLLAPPAVLLPDSIDSMCLPLSEGPSFA